MNSVKGSLEDSKTKLEAEIKALEDELANVADAAEMEELAKKLTEAQNQLKELEEKISDNAGEIVKLTTQIGQLAEIQCFHRSVTDI
ncbi:BREX-1 system adenine-specific DNA-methyltransferase PglX [Bacteroides salyersiae]|nr:BREX-1 system adenine-specific DNA-methyltransferase PglX [Bacteroides salyersiae]